MILKNSGVYRRIAVMEGIDSVPYSLMVGRSDEADTEKMIVIRGGFGKDSYIQMVHEDHNFNVCLPGTNIPMVSFSCNVYEPLDRLGQAEYDL